MTKKTRTIIGIVCVIVLAIVGGLYMWQRLGHKSVLKSGECAPGYVNYGIPLGCITKQKYENCQHTACPICLSSGTKIDTDKGWKQVTTLKPGDLVWSINNGQKILVPIIKTTKREVPQGTQLLHVVLQDGRNLLVSPNHPTASGQLFNEIAVGDTIDHSIVTQISKVSYSDGFTYDILPQSSSGDYWANGVLVGSTLK